MIGSPSAIGLQDGVSVDVYACGLNKRLDQRWWDGKAWNRNWAELDDGIDVLSPPTAVSLHQANREVFFHGPNGAVMRKTWGV